MSPYPGPTHLLRVALELVPVLVGTYYHRTAAVPGASRTALQRGALYIKFQSGERRNCCWGNRQGRPRGPTVYAGSLCWAFAFALILIIINIQSHSLTTKYLSKYPEYSIQYLSTQLCTYTAQLNSQFRRPCIHTSLEYRRRRSTQLPLIKVGT